MLIRAFSGIAENRTALRVKPDLTLHTKTMRKGEGSGLTIHYATWSNSEGKGTITVTVLTLYPTLLTLIDSMRHNMTQGVILVYTLTCTTMSYN